MIILDIIVRITMFVAVVYGIRSTIKDIKNGALEDFFG